MSKPKPLVGVSATGKPGIVIAVEVTAAAGSHAGSAAPSTAVREGAAELPRTKTRSGEITIADPVLGRQR